MELVECGWNILKDPTNNMILVNNDLVLPVEYRSLYGDVNLSKIIIGTIDE